MQTISEFLQRAALSMHEQTFLDKGYDHLPQLLTITEPQLDKLVADIAMPPGHIDRLRAALGMQPVYGANVAPAYAPYAAESPYVADSPPAANGWKWKPSTPQDALYTKLISKCGIAKRRPHAVEYPRVEPTKAVVHAVCGG